MQSTLKNHARRLGARLLMAALSFPALAAHAAPYPDRPVRLVVPYPPGGPNDVIARILAQKLTERMAQTFIVENKAGATGLTGTDHVSKSAPDGYTLLFNASVHVIYPSLFRKMTFDPIRDFAPISLVARAPLVLSVNPDVPAKSVKELIALAKSKPGSLQYASSGNGSATHLAAEAFKSQAGIDIQHIPYRGSAPAMSDTVAGHVQLVFDSLASSMPFIHSGRLRALAVTTAKRSTTAPDIPTIAEAGLPGYDISTWYGLWAPAGVAPEIIAKLSEEVMAILKTPDTRERLAALGVEPIGSTADALRAYENSEMIKWGRIVKDSGAQMD